MHKDVLGWFLLPVSTLLVLTHVAFSATQEVTLLPGQVITVTFTLTP